MTRVRPMARTTLSPKQASDDHHEGVDGECGGGRAASRPDLRTHEERAPVGDRAFREDREERNQAQRQSLRSGRAKMRVAARVSPTPIARLAATAIAKAIPASIPS